MWKPGPSDIRIYKKYDPNLKHSCHIACNLLLRFHNEGITTTFIKSLVFLLLKWKQVYLCKRINKILFVFENEFQLSGKGDNQCRSFKEGLHKPNYYCFVLFFKSYCLFLSAFPSKWKSFYICASDVMPDPLDI